MREDRRPSLWKSLKRALGGAPIEIPAEAPTPVPPPEPAAGVPPALSVQALPDVNSVPPFLAEAEPAAEPQSPPQPPNLEPAIPPGEPPKPTEAAAPQPVRLARGLASFSRRNPEREKKFAHLLHDNPSDGKKGSPPPGRRG